MSDTVLSHSSASDLRKEFDRSFSEAPHGEVAALEHLLAVRISTANYALRFSDVAGLFADQHVTRLPSAATELLGVAGFGGVMVPVYDLHALLGFPRLESPRWVALVATDVSIGLAFDQFDGQLRMPSEAFVPAHHQDTSRYVLDAVRVGTTLRPIVHIPSVIEAIKRLAPASALTKEQ